MDLKNKKVTVMGLGLYEYGSGIAATRFLISHGARVTVTDLKTAAQLSSQLKRLGPLADKINFVLGGHRPQDFAGVDLIIRNPGVPNTSPFLKIARKNKIPIETDISLFFQLVDRKKIIGVTGTRGKSTTTTLVYEIIKTADDRAILGGNITKSPLAQMAPAKKGGLAILELSSWMLESLKENKLSPYISVVTNIYPDHLNTYKNIAEYAAAKENIWRWQNAQDAVVLNRDNQFTLKMGSKVPSRRYWFSLKKFSEENGAFVCGGWVYFRENGIETKIIPIKEIKLLGEHNLANVLAAVCAGMIYGIRPAAIRLVVKKFKGLDDRLEFLREVRGVKFYNDTTSTTPEATMAALKALAQLRRRIILIAGGSDKGLDFKKLAGQIKKDCAAVVLLKGTGTVRLKKKINGFEVSSLAEAVNQAISLSRRGDIILLSPACASFGMFVNEFDRGRQFRQTVNKLK